MQVVFAINSILSLMTIDENVSLKDYSTMRLGGFSRYLTTVSSVEDMMHAIEYAIEHSLTIIVIGEGSNVIWRDEGFQGLTIINRIKGFTLNTTTEDYTLVSVGAGEIWDEVVGKTVDLGLSGLEFLSLIPGTTGATPIQNVGAYGQEIAKLLVELKAYDLKTKKLVTINNTDCNFSYRSSRFNTNDQHRFIILEVQLKLSKQPPKPPFYDSLNQYLLNNHITDFTAQTIRQAVITIRQNKLPDPKKIANCGSFFSNPTISYNLFTDILANYPDIIYWPTNNNQIKLSAAWLIEQAGFKDYYHEKTGFGTYSQQPLVIVNYKGKKTKDLASFVSIIQQAVKQKFNVRLSQEPVLLP